ncbi:hypothetical protein EJB05_12832, partial [Eragrostis curvula]
MADMTLYTNPANWGTPLLEIDNLLNEPFRARFCVTAIFNIIVIHKQESGRIKLVLKTCFSVNRIYLKAHHSEINTWRRTLNICSNFGWLLFKLECSFDFIPLITISFHLSTINPLVIHSKTNVYVVTFMSSRPSSNPSRDSADFSPA